MKKQNGFSLIELMISLVLGIIISGAIIQVLVSNQVTARLNQSMASAQEAGRFIIQRVRQDALWAGHHDRFDPQLNRDQDVIAEEAFIHSNPVNVAGDFVSRPALGSSQGADGAADVLVFSRLGNRDCRGLTHGYDGTELFHVVNEYFLDGEQLKCRGFDGRFLRGLKAAEGHEGHNAYTLLDGVIDFQVQFAIANPAVSPQNQASRPVQYITADQLPAEKLNGAEVVAIRIAFLIRGDGDANLNQLGNFRLLNEASMQAPDTRYYRQFETTVTLRNIKNQLELRR